MKHTLTVEYVDVPTPDAQERLDAAIKLMARSIVYRALTRAHRELGIRTPLPFTVNAADEPLFGPSPHRSEEEGDR